MSDVVDSNVKVNTSGVVLANTPRDYVISYTAIDSSGNKAKKLERKVKVIATVKELDDEYESLNASQLFQEVKVYLNNTASVIANVSINGEHAGDLVEIYVGEELRGKQQVRINAGKAWLPNALVNTSGSNEIITFKVYDASSGFTL